MTNRHVANQLTSGGGVIRVNPQGADPAREFDLANADGSPSSWAFHPDAEVDVAVVAVSFDVLRDANIQANFFTQTSTLAPSTDAPGKASQVAMMSFFSGFRCPTLSLAAREVPS